MPASPPAALFASAARTATVNGANFGIGFFPGGLAWLDITVATGTSPTLDVTIEDSPDGLIYATAVTFAQQTAAGSLRAVVPVLGPNARAVATIGGTSPSFTFQVQMAQISDQPDVS